MEESAVGVGEGSLVASELDATFLDLSLLTFDLGC